jgi:hypothetical protein
LADPDGAPPSADQGLSSNNQRPQAAASKAPPICAAMKPGASTGRMPEKLSVSERARVIAGLAKLVDDVNQ